MTKDVSSSRPVRAVQAWNCFWFDPADPTTLGLVRLCCGLVVFYVHLAYSYDLYTLFGERAWLDLPTINTFRSEAPVLGPPLSWDGLAAPRPPQTEEERQYLEEYAARWYADPRAVQGKGRYLWSVWFHVTDPTAMAVVHGGILAVMLAFAVGFCTRVTAVLTWLGMLSYIQRSPVSLFGMDTIMTVVVLYLMISPCGAALSVDRLIARYWATRRALALGQPAPTFGPPEPAVSANLALRLMQVHVCVIYFVAGVSKLQGTTWWSGTAAWATMANAEFSPLYNPLYAQFISWLPTHRWLWELTMSASVLFTLAFELCFAFLVWQRNWRWTMVTAAVLMHTGIALFMGLVTFSLMMLALVLCFVPAGTVHRLLWRLGRGRDGLRYAPA